MTDLSKLAAGLSEDDKGLSPIEIRVLAYLDQRGPSHRTNVVCDLASATSRLARNRGVPNGSNGATPLIMGKWCKRLAHGGLVLCVYDREGFYRHHQITAAGSKVLRTHLEGQK